MNKARIKNIFIITLILTLVRHMFAVFHFAHQVYTDSKIILGIDYYIGYLFGVGSNIPDYGFGIRIFGKSFTMQLNLLQYLLYIYINTFIVVGCFMLFLVLLKKIFRYVRTSK